MSEYEALCARQRREYAKIYADHKQLLEGVTGLRRAVLELHGPKSGDNLGYPECQGCDPGDYAASGAEFPCRTYTLAKNWATS